MLIPLNRHYLKAMLCVAAKEDVRYYLEGVCFVGGEGKLLAYSTDGHQMLRWIVCEDYQGSDFEYILDRFSIKRAIKSKYHVHLNIETAELVCAKDEDFLVFKGLIDGKYPDAKKVIARYVADTKTEKDPCILVNGRYLENLGKISRIIGKSNAIKEPPVRLYSSKATDGYTNIFTLGGVSNLIYIVASLRNCNETYSEDYAVTMDAEARDAAIVKARINNGFSVECGTSRHSHKAATSYANSKSRVFTILTYDDDSFMDADGEIWQYVCPTPVIKPKDVADVKTK